MLGRLTSPISKSVAPSLLLSYYIFPSLHEFNNVISTCLITSFIFNYNFYFSSDTYYLCSYLYVDLPIIMLLSCAEILHGYNGAISLHTHTKSALRFFRKLIILLLKTKFS